MQDTRGQESVNATYPVRLPPLSGDLFEDIVLACLHALGYYVEANASPVEPENRGHRFFEVDAIATLLRPGAPSFQIVVEAKSGDWGWKDVFKTHGVCKYLESDATLFIALADFDNSLPCNFAGLPGDPADTGLHCIKARRSDGPHGVDIGGLMESIASVVPTIGSGRIGLVHKWLYACRLQRQMAASLARKDWPADEGLWVAVRDYLHCIRDLIPTMRPPADRLFEIVQAYWGDPDLSDLSRQACTSDGEFDDALYFGRHDHVQGCLWLQTRARLTILVTAVQCLLVGEQAHGEWAERVARLGDFEEPEVLPRLWQHLIWLHGGVMKRAQFDEEVALLAEDCACEPRVVAKGIEAIDALLPRSGRWWKQLGSSDLEVFALVPAAFRGIGVFRKAYGLKAYTTNESGMINLREYAGGPGWAHERLRDWNNCAARALDPEIDSGA